MSMPVALAKLCIHALNKSPPHWSWTLWRVSKMAILSIRCEPVLAQV
jgi:hypothetical protein